MILSDSKPIFSANIPIFAAKKNIRERKLPLQLKGFRRIHLKSGESRTATFRLEGGITL